MTDFGIGIRRIRPAPPSFVINEIIIFSMNLFFFQNIDNFVDKLFIYIPLKSVFNLPI